MALLVRLLRSLHWPDSSRCAGGWLLSVLLAGSCLNPQPDPFPQADESAPQRQGPPAVDMAAVAEDGAGNTVPLAPEPEPTPGEQLPRPAAGPGSSPAGGPALAPPEDAGAPPSDAGADAGEGEGPLVGGG